MREIPAHLAADLHLLGEALYDAAEPLEERLQQLQQAMRDAVPSYLGLSITMYSDGQPFAFTTLLTDVGDSAEPGAEIATSARLLMTAFDGAEPGSTIVFYAARPGAFVDFAADVAFSLALPLATVALDEDLTASGKSVALRQVSRVNIAIGILIGSGQPPPAAAQELQRRADESGTSLVVAAETLIRQSPGRQPAAHAT